MFPRVLDTLAACPLGCIRLSGPLRYVAHLLGSEVRSIPLHGIDPKTFPRRGYLGLCVESLYPGRWMYF